MASGLLSSLRSMYGKLQDAVRGSGDDPKKIKSIEEDLMWLSRTLPRIVAVQQDAEEREIHDRSVELWLRELRGVAHEAEDVLDEYHYEVLKSTVENRSVTTEAESSHIESKRKIEEMSAPSSLASSLSNVAKILIPDGMADNIKRIRERFEEISRDRENLHLREGDGERRILGPQKRPPTSSHIDEKGLFGRENEKEEIISLISPENGPDFMIFPIVGKGGLGKTTLAQLIYNDPKIDPLFDKKVWISVSDDFNLVRLTKAIIEHLTKEACPFSELSMLQDILKEKLATIRLFLVLDDIWNEEKSLWENFRVSFLSAKFLRILITTRTYSVAKIMETVPSFKLNNLPEEKCRMIFKHYAFGNQDESEHTNLHRIGDNIVKKCNGLPLVVKVLGGLLRHEMNEERWKEVLESDTWEIDERKEIMPVLSLSYQNLPLHLRPCFIYLSVFPKGRLFKKENVIRLWMAQGYINPSRYKTLEERGSEYFEELRSRSLIDECSDGYGLHTLRPMYGFYGLHGFHGVHRLHDLIHDLASSINKRMCPAINNDEILDSSYPVYHFYFDNEIKLPSNYKAIRTLLSFGYQTDSSIILKMAWLHILVLDTDKLPDDIGILKHLRYLKIYGRALKSLPNSICLLYNLQTMDLTYCENLVELPRDVGNLINLRCLILKKCNIGKLPVSICYLCNLQILDLSYCNNLKKLPSGIGQLTSLRELKLTDYAVDMPSGFGMLKNLKTVRGTINVKGGLGELKGLINLEGYYLVIRNLKNINDVECKEINLKSKSNLECLELNSGDYKYFDKKFECSPCVIINCPNITGDFINSEESLLNNLQPHPNLKKLAICGYEGTKFPSWIVNPLLLQNLTNLYLEDCPNLYMILTIPNELEVLKIIDCGFHGIQFPSPCKMKQMEITECENLTSIIGLHDPKFLTDLTLKSCPLLEMPVDGLLQSITGDICIYNCPSLIFDIPTFNNIYFYLRDATHEEFPEFFLLGAHTFPDSSFALVCTTKVSANTFHGRVAYEPCVVLDVPIMENLAISSIMSSCYSEEQNKFDNLKHLYILGCSKLCQWEDECMPEHIEFLEISCCDELSTIPPLHNNLALREIRIWNCPKLNAIQGLHCLIFLRTLFLEDCQKLRVLPSVKLQTSLQTVQVHNCPWMIDWCLLNDIPNYKWRHSFRREDDAERNSDGQNVCEDDSEEYDEWLHYEEYSEEYSEDDRFFCKKGKEKISQ